jgi:hypothetical protein
LFIFFLRIFSHLHLDSNFCFKFTSLVAFLGERT